jgi:hypothetical protein
MEGVKMYEEDKFELKHLEVDEDFDEMLGQEIDEIINRKEPSELN